MGYEFFLPMVLRWRASRAEAPLLNESNESMSHESIGNLSKGVFERRTATGNEPFSLFTRLGGATFVILGVFSLIETIYLKTRAHPLPKNESCPLPVAVRRSKMPLLKLPIESMSQV